MDHHKRVQTSEAFINSAFLAVSGGFQDAYTYFTRDGVFSNAQTGNVVLMSERFMNGEVKAGLHYLIPLTAFFLGVLLAERIQEKFRYARRLHWRQGILLVEIILLFLVGFIPGNLNVLATTLVSFSCALQVQTFRKVEGNAYASTMCIGNLRSGTAALSASCVKESHACFVRPYATSPLFSCLPLAQELAADFQWLTAKEPSGYPASCFSSASF